MWKIRHDTEYYNGIHDVRERMVELDDTNKVVLTKTSDMSLDNDTHIHDIHIYNERNNVTLMIWAGGYTHKIISLSDAESMLYSISHYEWHRISKIKDKKNEHFKDSLDNALRDIELLIPNILLLNDEKKLLTISEINSMIGIINANSDEKKLRTLYTQLIKLKEV